MNLTVSRKLVLGAVLNITVLAILFVALSSSLGELGGLQNVVVDSCSTAQESVDLNGQTDAIVHIIYATLPSHDLVKGQKDWDDETKKVSSMLGELEKSADKPEEKAALKKLQDSFDDFKNIWEKEILPDLRTNKDAAQVFAEISGKIEKANGEMSSAAEDFKKEQTDQVNEVDGIGWTETGRI